MPAVLDFSTPHVLRTKREYRAAALEVAEKSIVLLKNEGGQLPLGAEIKHIALIGPLADDHHVIFATKLACGADGSKGRIVVERDDSQTPGIWQLLEGLEHVGLADLGCVAAVQV